MEDKIVLEIGSSDGYDTEKLYNKWKCPVYGFEPVPQNIKILNEKFKNNTDISIIEAAIDINNGESDFYISNPDGVFADGSGRIVHPYGCSSLHTFDKNIHQKWPNRPDFNVVETVKVKTIRLDTFLDYHNFDGEIVYLHCDAQGNDVNVLKSLGKYIHNVVQGEIEVAAKTTLYENTKNSVDDAYKFFTKTGGFDFRRPGKKYHEASFKFNRKR